MVKIKIIDGIPYIVIPTNLNTNGNEFNTAKSTEKVERNFSFLLEKRNSEDFKKVLEELKEKIRKNSNNY